MIPKPLSEVTSDDLDALISNQVAEGKTIEYKRDLPGGTDQDKKEFLADVSSFSNTIGGDLLFGIEARSGLPASIPGVVVSERETLRLDSMIQSGLSPRIRHHSRVMQHKTGVTILILRMDQSWIGPHRVILGGHDKFYARNSSGKYALDVTELRHAFLGAATVVNTIRGFRQERLIEIAQGNTPLPLRGSGGKLAIHIVPLQSFVSPPVLDVKSVHRDPERFLPLILSSGAHRFTLEGLLCHNAANHEGVHGYAHLYRNGVIEALDAYLFQKDDRPKQVINGTKLEQVILSKVDDYLHLLISLGVGFPIYVFLSLLDAKGYSLRPSTGIYEDEADYPLNRTLLQIPETVFTESSALVGATMRGSLDLLWNSFGFKGSPNFDAKGAWAGKQVYF